mmetsp:Transcript_26236/g.38568  ORF Transcript_26236/g.38568 Transcript_26236/m.38568 type:complete len:174 (+) Transcript_26236:48-569(+)
MFETLEHTFTMLCSKSAGVAHTQSLEHHYLVNFGATQIDNQNVGENWVRDAECSCVATPMNDAMDNQGMFNNYASVLDTWTDTTNFDNVRGPAFAHDGIAVAGGTEYMTSGNAFHADTSASGSPHPLEQAEAKAGTSVTPLVPGQSNIAGRAIGVASKAILYNMPVRHGLHSK